MSALELAMKIVRRESPLRKSACSLMGHMVASSKSRGRLNEVYQRSSYGEKKLFHALFAKIFRDNPRTIEQGTWKIAFLDRNIDLPLENDSLWLDWDSAVSILGHDTEIKITYETLLKSDSAPRLFFDIGANYGTHSLLFLSQGVDVIGFEPNPFCVEVFNKICDLNGFTGKMERLALGDKEGSAVFWFPEQDTWLGTLDPERSRTLQEAHELQSLHTRVCTLDVYVNESGAIPDVVKIDTEGFELNVLTGAQNTLGLKQTLVFFECNETAERAELFTLFWDMGYRVCRLPILPGHNPVILDSEGFETDKLTNFIAVPVTHALLS